VRALVRQDDSVLVRLEPKGHHEALAETGDTVRADVLLREPPARWIGIADENSAFLPLRETRGCLLLGVGQRQVDDVVRVSSLELFPLLRPDDVVRRSDERLERAADSRVVAERAERPYDCHGTDRTNRTASLPPLRLVRATTGDPSVHAQRLSWANSTLNEARSPNATTRTRHKTRPLQRKLRLRSRLRSGMRRRRWSMTSTCSRGTTAMTAEVGIR
jgi:hypothetical protein